MFRKLKQQLSCIECASLKAEDIYRANLKQERERMGRAHSRPDSIQSGSIRSRSSSLPASSRRDQPPNYGHDDSRHSLRPHEATHTQSFDQRNRPRSQISVGERERRHQSFDRESRSSERIPPDNLLGKYSSPSEQYQRQHEQEQKQKSLERNHHSESASTAITPNILRQNPGRRIRRASSNGKRRTISSDPQEMTLGFQPSEIKTDSLVGKGIDTHIGDHVDSNAATVDMHRNVLRRETSAPCGINATGDLRTRSVSFTGRDKRSKHEAFARRRANSFTETGDGPDSVALSGDGISRSLVSIVNNEWQSQNHLANLGSDSGSASTAGSHKQVKSILKNKTNSMDCSHDSQELRKRVNSVTFADMQQNTPRAIVRHSYPINNRHKLQHVHRDVKSTSFAPGNVKNAECLRDKPPLPQSSRSIRGSKDEPLIESYLKPNTSSVAASQMKHLWRYQGNMSDDKDRTQSPSPSYKNRCLTRLSPCPSLDEMDILPDDDHKLDVPTRESPSPQPRVSPTNLENDANETCPPVPARKSTSSVAVQARSSHFKQKDLLLADLDGSNSNPSGKKRLSRSRIQKSKTLSLPRHGEDSDGRTLIHERQMTRSHSLDSDNCSTSASSGTSSSSGGATSKSNQRVAISNSTDSMNERNKEATRTTIPKIKKGRSSNHRPRKSLSATRKLERYDSSDSGLCMDTNISPLMSPAESTDTETKGGTLQDAMQRSGFTKLTLVPVENAKTNVEKTETFSTDCSSRIPEVASILEDLDEIMNYGKKSSKSNSNVSEHDLNENVLNGTNDSSKKTGDHEKSTSLEKTPVCQNSKSLSTIPEYNRGRIRRKSMDNMLNISISSDKSDDIIVHTDPNVLDKTSSYNSKSLSYSPQNLHENPPSSYTEALVNESMDWTLVPEDLPTSSIDSKSQQSLPEFSDIVLSCGDKSMMSFMHQNDCSRVIIPRDRIRTGRLMMRDESNTFCICAGSYLIPNTSKRGVPYCKPITVQIYRGLNDKEDRVNLLKNTTALLQLQHPNVQGVYGMCMEGSPHTRDGYEVMLLMERTHYLVTLSKLLKWTSENNPQLMTAGCAVTFGQQMCEGLQFLENQGIIHANLSSHSIRVDPGCNLKIGGIEQFPVSSTAAPIRWMSLETLSTGQVIPKSAVWTFAVILWEILSVGARPYSKLKTGQILSQLSKGHRLQRPEICPEYLYHLMLHCWQSDPETRSTFPAISKTLVQYEQQTLPSKSPIELFPDREDLWEIVHDHI